MTFEGALPEIKKLLFAYKQKLMSIDRFLLQIDSVLNSIKTEELASFKKYQVHRDTRRSFSYTDNNGNSLDYPIQEMISSLQAIVVELERKVLETEFVRDIKKKEFTKVEMIKGLKELKGKTKVEAFNVLTWLDIMYDVSSKIFGSHSDETYEIQKALGEYKDDIPKHTPSELILKYKLKSNEIIESYISTLSTGIYDEIETKKETTMPEQKQETNYKKLFFGLLAVVLILLGGAYKLGWDNGYSRYDNDKVQLYDKNIQLNKDISVKNDSMAYYHYQLEKMLTTNETLIELMKKQQKKDSIKK